MEDDRMEVSISDNVSIELIKSTGVQMLLNSTDQKK